VKSDGEVPGVGAIYVSVASVRLVRLDLEGALQDSKHPKGPYVPS
jgi:hypothetical protein